MRFPKLTKAARRRLVIIIFSAAAASALWWNWRAIDEWLFPTDPLVATPGIVCEQVQAQSLYFNGIATAWLEKMRPDLLKPQDRDSTSPRRRAFLQATQNPKLFRQLDRQYRFDTLLLVGDPSNYQRLLDHLIEPPPDKRDFRLVYLDHWACVFKRTTAREWQPADAEPVRQKIATLRARDRASFLAMAAGKMLALRQIEPAKRWLDEAVSLDSGSKQVLGGLASYHISIGRWIEAETFADKALRQDEDFVPALAAKIVAMRATKHHIDAFKLSVRLNKLLPEEPVRLWQHAQLAHEARQISAEITALTRLIILAKEQDRPTADYEFFLGEAHIHAAADDVSHAPLALEHLRKAVADPLLAADKRKLAEEHIANIHKVTGLK